MRKTDGAERLRRLIGRGTSPFHAAEAVEQELLEAGYEPLVMNRPWQLERGGKYYVKHHGSTVAAFSVGNDGSGGFRIAAAHTDFPGLRVKQHAELVQEGYARLNVEVYGGAILNTWLDRPLSASGRVALRSDDVFRPQMRLVDLKRPLFVIPNLAIHLNREVNKGVELNRQKELLPIAGAGGETISQGFFRELLARELKVRPEEILDYEIGLYNADRPEYVGMEEELLSAPRIDNLSGVQAILDGMLEGGREGVNVAVFFDHEEVGSRTKQGAGSTLLSMVLERISLGLERERGQFLQDLADSMLLSVDVGHAFHPNYGEKMDPTNHSGLNRGFCIKEASSQSYATDSWAVAVIEQLCMQEEIPYTKYFNRSDGTSGSTLGSIASSMIPVPTVDVGVPVLAMHSARELMGVRDMQALTDMVRAYYGA
ncbi:MAG: M18 family aminopeptidase [Eubacteriales bacterium]|nr:M18 family aminopeptidase [Eubacteriales bacterium]